MFNVQWSMFKTTLKPYTCFPTTNFNLLKLCTAEVAILFSKRAGHALYLYGVFALQKYYILVF